MYYDEALSSVYITESPQEGFKAVFLIKKELRNVSQIREGSWDAIHYVNCQVKKDSKAEYSVRSTVMLSLDMNSFDQMAITGNCSKFAIQNVQLPSNLSKEADPDMFHLRTIGKMIEANETQLRSDTLETYVNKQRQILNQSRQKENFTGTKEAVLSEVQEATKKFVNAPAFMFKD